MQTSPLTSARARMASMPSSYSCFFFSSCTASFSCTQKTDDYFLHKQLLQGPQSNPSQRKAVLEAETSCLYNHRGPDTD